MARPKKTAAPVRHRPVIKRGLDAHGRVYRLVCTCGRTGEEHQTRSLAKRDMDRHISTLPLVPEQQQCRDPRRHNRREWEPYEMCEHQTTLFDLGDVAR